MPEEFAIVAIAFNVVLLLVFVVTAINVSQIRKAVQVALFPEGIPDIARRCPSCYRQMPARAAVCSFCQRESEPWVLEDDRWWTTSSEGKRVYLDPATRTWVEAAENAGA